MAHPRLSQLGLRLLLPLAAGAAASCGFEPLGWWPVALLGVACLLLLVAHAQGPRSAALLGWLWGLGHFTLGLNWIATAFTYQAKMPGWLGWGAVVVLSAYLAVWPAVAAGVGWFFRRHGLARVLGFAGCWIVAEWCRGWVLTGFAWNPLGAIMLGDFAHPGLATVAPWLGSYGLSGLVVVLAGVMGFAVQRRRWALAAGPLLLVGAAMHWPTPPQRNTAIAYTLIQPNVTQADLSDPARFDAQYHMSAALSAARPSATWRAGQPRLVLWPESGVPEYIRDGYPYWFYQYTYLGDATMARWRLAQAVGQGGLLLTGTDSLDVVGERVVGGQNSVVAIDGRGRLVASYAKAHLVPFGEYLPWRDVLKPLGLERVIPGDMDFRAGPGPQTLDLGPLGRAGLQICYEIVFPGAVVDRAHRPDYIVNPSNDGWYGDWGPPQHVAQARLRALEEGLPVLRSTTNGISVVIDAAGVVRAHAGRHVAARLDGLVPQAAPPTWFSRAGNMLCLGMGLVLLAASALVLWRARR
jgi:apolipoprotein N-acyltransferase